MEMMLVLALGVVAGLLLKDKLSLLKSYLLDLKKRIMG